MKERNNYDDLYKKIGLRIAGLIEAHGETQAVLANALGYDDHQTVTYWVNGKRKPNLGQLLAIAQRYNVSMDYLTTFSDAKTDVTPEGKELQFVCDYTGLSVDAVNSLQSPVLSNEHLHHINFVLENYSYQIGSSLREIEKTTKAAEDALCNITNTPDKLLELEKVSKELKLQLFYFSELSRQIVSKSSDSYTVIERLEQAIKDILLSDEIVFEEGGNK